MGQLESGNSYIYSMVLSTTPCLNLWASSELAPNSVSRLFSSWSREWMANNCFYFLSFTWPWPDLSPTLVPMYSILTLICTLCILYYTKVLLFRWLPCWDSSLSIFSSLYGHPFRCQTKVHAIPILDADIGPWHRILTSDPDIGYSRWSTVTREVRSPEDPDLERDSGGDVTANCYGLGNWPPKCVCLRRARPVTRPTQRGSDGALAFSQFV